MTLYIFLSGFLGSGKTTLLNTLLKTYKGMRIGVIVNDFGEMGIDTSLIDTFDLEEEIQELKAGQIFCSCLSGSFVKSVLAYREIKPELLIVECSGLAKPSGLRDITRAIDLEAPGEFTCGGMVCLVDGERHMQLEQSLMVLTEQMEASDVLLITKADLLETPARDELFLHLTQRYPFKEILFSTRGKFDGDLLDLLAKRRDAYLSLDTDRFNGWGKKGRPTSFVITPHRRTAREMHQSLTPYLGRLYRIKGEVETTDRGSLFFDGTSAGIEMRKPPRHMDPGLVVITHDQNLQFELGFL
jgi:G3E family GTPase